MLTDFLSVLVTNKREDIYSNDSPIQFTSNYILKFLEEHRTFVKNEEVIKIFIMQRKFRLTLLFIQKTNAQFNIDFFTKAIEANAYEIAFYLLNVYEEKIIQNSAKALEAHVSSYSHNKQFLKSKLTMSKKMINIFNFKSAKVFLHIIQTQIFERSLEGNLFSHSANPLLNMCLLYELLLMILRKFFSLNNICRTLMTKTMEMAIIYIKSVDDENFLTAVLLEEDFFGRDSLRIAVELELLDLIQTPKVEAIVKRIYNSDYDQAGNLFQTSSAYQIVLGNHDQREDIEPQLRFYKKRDINNTDQSQWLYHIFKRSMNSRLNAQSMIGVVFVAVQLIYYKNFIEIYENQRPTLTKLVSIRQRLVASNDLVEIDKLIHESHHMNGESTADEYLSLY